MTTKLSESLRELRDEFDLLNTMEDAVRCNPAYQPNIQAAGEQSKRVEALLEKSIAQAEAQEKLAYFEARVRPSSDDPTYQECEAMCGDHGGIEGCSCSVCSTPLGPRELCAYCNGCGRRVKWPMSDGTEYRAPVKEAQAGELSDAFVKARAMEIYPPDEVNDGHPWYGHRRAIEDTAARQMVRHLHKCGYLRPSQAIGEQTPVAWMDPVTKWVITSEKKSAFSPNDGKSAHPMATFSIPLFRSPMSSEARDKAIERVEEMLCGISHVYTVYERPTHNDAIRAMHEMNAFAIKALSALRGE
jgi:hypothetical protein